MDLRLLQREVAERIGADATSIWNWENGTASPELQFMPGILAFLGDDPRPKAKAIGEELVRYREGLGWPQKRLAKVLQVDPTTLSRWELGKRSPRGIYVERVTCAIGRATQVG